MPIIVELVERYLPQIIGTILIIGLFSWWYHEIISETEDRVNAAWYKRDAGTARQADDFLNLSNMKLI